MWILISETIIFGIILALILGYFGGWSLGVNKEVKFKEIVNENVIHAKNIINQLKKNGEISTYVNYKVEKVISQNNNTSYISYKLILTDKKGNPLPEEELVRIRDLIVNNGNNANNNNNNNSNNNNYVAVNNSNISVDGNLSAQRDNGMCYYFVVKNNGTDPFYNWKITFNLDSNILITDKRNWTGSCNNGVCEMMPLSWANPLDVSKSVNMGFCIQGSNKEPSNIKLKQLYIAPKEEILNIPSSCNDILSFNGSNQFDEKRMSDYIAGLDLWNLKSASGYAKFCYDSNSKSIYYAQDLSNIKKQSNAFVIGYPELYVGSKPWNNYKEENNGELPVKLGEIEGLENEISYSVRTPSNLSMNIATEGWFTRNKYDNASNSSSREWIEFMIMWYRNLHEVYGTYKGDITVNMDINGESKSVTFKVYVSEDNWKFVKLVPTIDNNIFKDVSIKFDIKKIVELVNDKISNDLINDYYLASWHFGTEWGDPYTRSAYLSRKVSKFKVRKIMNTHSNKLVCNNPSINLSLIKFNNSFKFDKNKDVIGNGKVGTIARYRDIATYKGKSIDLLVKIKELKGISSLYRGNSTPKGFKHGKVGGVNTVGFFIKSKKVDPKGTVYSARLNFTFVYHNTNIPVKLSFTTQIRDLDDSDNRLEKIQINKNFYSYYQISKNSFIKSEQVNGLSTFYSYIPVGLNYEFDVKHGRTKYGDVKSDDKNAMIRFIHSHLSSFDINFIVVKKNGRGKSFGKAGYLLLFGDPKDGLKGCDNIKTNNRKESGKLSNSLIYYGWPSVINGSDGNIDKAEQEFSKYKLVILGWGLQDPSHGDYNNTKKIIKDLKGKVRFYGYVPMVNGGSMSYEKVVKTINDWQGLGVDGIFIDEAGYDYWDKYFGLAYYLYKAYLQNIYNYIKLKGLKVIYNSWNPDDILNNLSLSSGDIVMIESFYYSDGEKKKEYINHVKEYLNKILSLSENRKPEIYCVATGKSNDKKSVDNIWNDIKDKLSICDYVSIQDDYGADENASVIIPGE